MDESKNAITKKTINPIEKIIHTYSCVQKKDKFYPLLIMSVVFTIMGGIMETSNTNLGNYLLGYYNLFLSNNSKAINYFKKVDDTNNQFEYYNAMLGLAYNQNHQYVLANQALLNELKQNPCHIAVLIKLAYNSLCEKNYKDVISYINQYEKEAHIASKIIEDKSYDTKSLDISKKELSKNFEINFIGAAHLNMYLYRGIANYNLNQYDKALDDLNTVITWGSKDDKNVIEALSYRSLIQQKQIDLNKNKSE